MRITESKLRRIIKEEIIKEGFFDFFPEEDESDSELESDRARMSKGDSSIAGIKSLCRIIDRDKNIMARNGIVTADYVAKLAKAVSNLADIIEKK